MDRKRLSAIYTNAGWQISTAHLHNQVAVISQILLCNSNLSEGAGPAYPAPADSAYECSAPYAFLRASFSDALRVESLQWCIMPGWQYIGSREIQHSSRTFRSRQAIYKAPASLSSFCNSPLAASRAASTTRHHIPLLKTAEPVNTISAHKQRWPRHG